MGMHEAPAPTQRSASGTCGSHQSGEPLSDAAALETPPGLWPGRLPLASCHCMSRLVSHPGPGTRGACHVRSSGSLCSEKKKVSRLSNWRKHLNADTYIFPSLVSQGSGGQRAHLGPGRGRGRLRGLRGLGPACLFSSSGPLGLPDRPGSALRALFSVLFLFCKPLGFLPCSLPEHTLHLASRGSCAGICEESAVCCPTVRWPGLPARPPCPALAWQHAAARRSPPSPPPPGAGQQGA